MDCATDNDAIFKSFWSFSANNSGANMQFSEEKKIPKRTVEELKTAIIISAWRADELVWRCYDNQRAARVVIKMTQSDRRRK